MLLAKNLEAHSCCLTGCGCARILIHHDTAVCHFTGTNGSPARRPGIPLITGGNGWRIQALMQWATAYDMPVAVGVAKAWGDYVPGTRSGRGRGMVQPNLVSMW